MKDCGLGTPATRASIIETLIKRGYITRDRQHLVATAVGGGLIRALRAIGAGDAATKVASLASAELTGAWEARLAQIARGQDSRSAFMADIRRFVTDIIDAIRGSAPPEAPPAVPIGRCPQCGGGVVARARDYPCTSCDFAMPNRVAGRMIAPALAGVLLGRGRSQVLRGFRSKKGRSFAAALRLEAGGKLAFEFEGGPRRERANGRADDNRANDHTDDNRANDHTDDNRANADDVLTNRSAGRRASTASRGRTNRRSSRASTTSRDIDSLALACPRCAHGRLLAGSRGWGCSRWREGCRFVVWFETAGKALTTGQLRDLVTRGKTRKAKFGAVDARLVLDLAADGGSARLEPISGA
jgi:DNA topoisomerase-3